jgi:hypothetical protein
MLFSPRTLVGFLGGFTFVSISALASTINFSDSFEASTINPFWTTQTQNGSLQLSSAISFSGSQSVEFIATGGGQREVHLEHNFGEAVTGDFSVEFYDYAPGAQTLYEDLYLFNSIDPNENAFIGVQDFDASCYAVGIAGGGPNATCGSFPQETTTNVSRAAGWHLLDLNIGSSSVTASIDGVNVYTASGKYSYDSFYIGISGPAFRPNTIAYFDDFSLSADPATGVPEPGTFVFGALAILLAGLQSLKRQSVVN